MKENLQPEQVDLQQTPEAAPVSETPAAPQAEKAPKAAKAAPNAKAEPKGEKTPGTGKPAMDKEEFKEKIWEPMLRPVVALVVICLIASLLLGITNNITKPIIEANNQAVADNVRKELLPAADTFEEVNLDPLPANISSMYKATNGSGYVVEAYGNGYGGKVPAMIAFDAEGTIVGVKFLENNETPGLGKKLNTDKAFTQQFINRPNEAIPANGIDKIASATVSSNAGLLAINSAIALFNEQVLGLEEGTISPEQVPAYLLPDAKEFTPLQLTAENVQQAYKADDGNYIIYGVGKGIYGKPVIAAVAMDEQGVILNLWLDTSGETQGYGKELGQDKDFVGSFIGKTSSGGIDAVADATISSNSVFDAVQAALQALPQAKEAA